MYMRAYIQISVYIHKYIHKYIHTYIHTYILTLHYITLHTYIIYIYICMCVCARVILYIYMCTFVCVQVCLFLFFLVSLFVSLSLSISLRLFLCALLQNDFLQGLCALFWVERLFLRQRHCVQVRGTASAFCRFLWGLRPSVQGCQMSHCSSTQCLSLQANTTPALIITSSTGQGGGGSFKNRKPI